MKKEKGLFFHLTSPENADKIRKEGIKPSHDGYVYIVRGADIKGEILGRVYNSNTLNEVAKSQCGLNEFVPVIVNVGGLELERDNVAEIPSWLGHQFRVKTDLIPVKKCKVGNYVFKTFEGYTYK